MRANEELVLASALPEAPARSARWSFVMSRSQHNAGRYADANGIAVQPTRRFPALPP